jgi:N-acetylneuraminic acid mutarotase
MSFAYAYRGVTPDHHIFQVPSTITNNSPRVQSWDIAGAAWSARTNGSITIERGLCVGAVGPFVYCTGGAYESSASNFTVQTATRQFNADAGTWATMRVHPAPRDGAVCPLIRGVSVMFCGGTAGVFTSTGDRGSTTVYEYTGPLNVYTSRTGFTGNRTEAGYGFSTAANALSAQYGFIAGGWERATGVSSFLASCYEYDANGDAWTSKTALPGSRFAGGAFTIENESYMVGGSNAGGENEQVDGYEDGNIDDTVSWNRTSDAWTTRTDIPGANRRSIACSQINGKGYAAGGSSDGVGTTNYALHYEYDPVADAWTTLTTYNTPASIVFRGSAA